MATKNSLKAMITLHLWMRLSLSSIINNRYRVILMLIGLCTPIVSHAQFRLIQTSPVDRIADVDLSEPIKLYFSEQPDLETFNRESFFVRGTRSGVINGSFQTPGQSEVVFIPDNEYVAGEVITVRVNKNVTSQNGEPLEAIVQFSFRVISAAQVRMSVDETLLGTRSAQSIIRSDQDPELTYEVLLGRAEDLAVDRLGLDVVQVSSYTVGLERATAIQTGWYLSPSTYFGIIHEVYETTPRTLFRLEYALKENLELVLTQGNDRRQGIDLLWGNDY